MSKFNFRTKATLGAACFHTLLWVFLEGYPTTLYKIVMFFIVIMLVTYAIASVNPKLSKFFTTMIAGFIPSWVSMQFPEFSLFAVLICFLSLPSTMVDQEYGWEVINLSIFHFIGYILEAFYYITHEEEFKDTQLPKILSIPGTFWQIVLLMAAGHFLTIICSLQKAAEQRRQREYEEKLVLLNHQLESSNRLLQESNRKLELALLERENFILRFSHEIRNPLNCVLGNLELSLDTTTCRYTREMLQEAIVCGEILLQLLNNVLDTGKLATGRLEVSRKSHNIREFLERMWIVSSEIIHKKGLSGCLYLNKKMPSYVDFDAHRMMQIIINLVSNAAKFTKSGFANIYFDFEETEELSTTSMLPRYHKIQSASDESTIEEYYYTCIDKKNKSSANSHEVLSALNKKFCANGSSVQERAERKGYLRIEIADSGCGMTSEALEALFTKFGQVHDDNSVRQVGTGLGLWITKELVEIMGGKIKAYSAPSVGTTFVIMIKSGSQLAQNSPLGPVKVRKDRALSKKQSLYKSRVLVVDDAIYNREINCKFFTKAGITETEIAENGLEAVETFVSKGPGYFTLISMDIDMPVMNGKEAIRRIREYEEEKGWSPVPIIIITAYSEANTKDELLDPKGKYKANLFLSKPTSFNVIQKAVEDIMQLLGLPLDPFCSPPETAKHETKELILIVDDDKFNQLTLTKMFQHLGTECVTASSGDEAIAEFKKHGPKLSLVVTDCEMQPVDGFAVAKEINEIMKASSWKGLKKVPIIGISGNQGIEFERKCLEGGMARLMTKPISLSAVQEIMHIYLRLESPA